MIELGVNIDHVATIRQARRTYEPDPVWAAIESELGGADGITVHLREDRRHINDRDVRLLKETVQCKLNLEMSVAPEIVEIAVRTLPDQATLVPERRAEITTEGGIDLTGDTDATAAVKKLKDKGVFISAFIDPDELHTGNYANAEGKQAQVELDRLRAAAELAQQRGLRLHAGHGLNYRNI